MEDGSKKRVKFSPMDKILRSIVLVYYCIMCSPYSSCSHEVAETAGLIAYSFGAEEVDRHVVLFKKVTYTCRHGNADHY